MRNITAILSALTIVTLMNPSPGLAIPPPIDDGVATLCILTGEDAENASNGIEEVVPFVLYHLYFVLYNPQIESDTLGAMTFSWRLEPTPVPAPIVMMYLPPNAISIGTLYNVIVGFGTGVPVVDHHAVVVSVELLFFSSIALPTYIYLGPADPTSIPGQMEYNDFFNPGNILPAHPYSDGEQYDNPVFGFGLTVAAESSTWGGVKALFR